MPGPPARTALQAIFLAVTPGSDDLAWTAFSTVFGTVGTVQMIALPGVSARGELDLCAVIGEVVQAAGSNSPHLVLGVGASAARWAVDARAWLARQSRATTAMVTFDEPFPDPDTPEPSSQPGCARSAEEHDDRSRLERHVPRGAGFRAVDACLDLTSALLGEVASDVAALELGAWRRRSPVAAQDDPFSEAAPALHRAMCWAMTRLEGKVSVDAMAQQALMSPRTFARQFRSATGESPYAWLLRQRVRYAAQIVERQPSATVAQIAAGSGFTKTTTLQRDFRRHVGVSLSNYRQRWQPSSPQGAPHVPRVSAEVTASAGRNLRPFGRHCRCLDESSNCIRPMSPSAPPVSIGEQVQLTDAIAPPSDHAFIEHTGPRAFLPHTATCDAVRPTSRKGSRGDVIH